jgi:hypothetical protein
MQIQSQTLMLLCRPRARATHHGRGRRRQGARTRPPGRRRRGQTGGVEVAVLQFAGGRTRRRSHPPEARRKPPRPSSSPGRARRRRGRSHRGTAVVICHAQIERRGPSRGRSPAARTVSVVDSRSRRLHLGALPRPSTSPELPSPPDAGGASSCSRGQGRRVPPSPATPRDDRPSGRCAVSHPLPPLSRAQPAFSLPLLRRCLRGERRCNFASPLFCVGKMHRGLPSLFEKDPSERSAI